METRVRQPIQRARSSKASQISISYPLIGQPAAESIQPRGPFSIGGNLVTKARKLSREQKVETEEETRNREGTFFKNLNNTVYKFRAKYPLLQKFWFNPTAAQISLLDRLNETAILLEDAHKRLEQLADRGIDVTPGGEWLLDNYYVVRRHINFIKESMPKDYYQKLPKLKGGIYSTYPRIYEIGLELISVSDGVVEEKQLSIFIKEFQRTNYLRMGELWALPLMLRLGLIGNIWRMTTYTLEHLESIEEADAWITEIFEADDSQSAVLRFISSPPELTSSFVSRFVSRSRKFTGASSPLYWLDRFIAERGIDAEDAMRNEHESMARLGVVMANSINSLRNIQRVNWLEFLEKHSKTEAILRKDPSDYYRLMTPASRDTYRHAVERIAYRSGMAEENVAKTAVQLARLAFRASQVVNVQKADEEEEKDKEKLVNTKQEKKDKEIEDKKKRKC